MLADRTVVYMNSESRLKYPVMFGGKNRMVELEGEAYFLKSPRMKSILLSCVRNDWTWRY